jgi:predicted nucleotide-binding protein
MRSVEVKQMAKTAKQNDKRSQLSQSDFPIGSLAEAPRIARALNDNFAGGNTAPHDIAMAIDLSPTSSQWRMLAGCALAYGLTTGSFSADKIGLTDLGRRIVAPVADGEDRTASVEATLRPRIMREFFQKYDKNKFPRDDIAKNVLVQMGIPRERVDRCLEILLENGKSLTLIRDTKTGLFVALDVSSSGQLPPTKQEHSQDAELEDVINVLPLPIDPKTAGPAALNNRVFISHGKNRKVLDQLKTVIAYGNFEPVVSVDNETVSKPLSDKVLDDMRSCSFAVIHVEDEKSLLDSDGEKHIYLNQNVLIEIGAALALHKSRFVLLVKEGVQLPSNLQGLYQCRYTGETLDFDATMRLLKAFNEFRGKP